MAIYKTRYHQFPDEHLMKLIQGGNTNAFNELYDRYSKRLLHYFYRMLGQNEEKAQDFLQDLFLRVIEKTDFFDPDKNFSTWIFTIANNLCKNEYRRMDVRKNVNHFENMDVLLTDEQSIDEDSFVNAINNELNHINIDQRNTFILRYQQNLSIKEISEILECNEGTIKSRLFYTTKKLAEKLSEYNPNNTKVS